MRPAVRLTLAAVAGYGLGNMPSSAVAARFAGGDHDLTVEGTGNPGAANATHVLGPRWGAAVTMADIAKAVAAARLGRRMAGAHGADLAATMAVVGHCHPVGRRGGKGVAASIGQVIGTVPTYLPLDAAVAFASSKLPWFRHRTRAATTAGSIVWVAATTLWWRRRWPNPGGPAPTWTLPTGAAVSSIVIAERFRAETARVDDHHTAVTAAAVEPHA